MAHDDNAVWIQDDLGSVRPYALVHGRVRATHPELDRTSLVQATREPPRTALQTHYAQVFNLCRSGPRSVAEIANLNPNDYQPYVGRSAFAHKGGVHGAAVAKVERSYQHVDPAAVGNVGRLVVSELGGRANTRIRAEQRLRSPDIYGRGTVTREVFSLRGKVRPGNSGGPLVSMNGQVLGVIFAASVSDKQTGYALTADQVAQAAARGIEADRKVSSGNCA